jgi:hypothetical protein
MRKSIYRDDYEQMAKHILETGDLRIIPMLEFITRCAAEKILIELDRAGLTARNKSSSGHGSMRIISQCAAPSMIAHYLNERAKTAPPRAVVNSTEDDRRYDPASSVLIVGGPCAVFERGRWFPRCDFAGTLFDACWEPGMVVRLRTRDKQERCFVVCGDLDPLDLQIPPTPQWLEEVRLIDGEWQHVDGGVILMTHGGKRVTLQEVRV